MAGRLHRLRTSLPPRAFLFWAPLAVLFAALFLSALTHALSLPAQVTRNANSHQQRVIIDPATGAVFGLAGEGSGTGSAFDVAPDEQEMGTHGTAKPAEEAAGEASPPAPTAQLATGNIDDAGSLRSAPLLAQFPVVPRAGDSLVEAPAPEVTEKLGTISLPKRSDKSSPSQLYARGFSRGKATHLLAVVITDAGFSPDSLNAILNLPKDVSVAVSPYAPDLDKQIASLHHAGHEVWAMQPAMDASYPQNDPGPLGLLTSLSPDQVLARADNVMAATLGSVGLVLPPAEAITGEPKVFHTLTGELSHRGMLLLDGRTVGTPSADPANLQYADLVLDSTPSAAFIKSKLSTVTDQADEQPQFVLLASARPQTLSMLRDYLANLPGSLTLAPLSALYATPPTAEPAKDEKKEEAAPEKK